KANVIARLARAGWSQRRIGRYIGYSQSYVSKLLFLGSMPEDIIAAVRDRRISAREIMNVQGSPDAVRGLRQKLFPRDASIAASESSPRESVKEVKSADGLLNLVETVHAISRNERRSFALDWIERLTRGVLASQGSVATRSHSQAPEFDWKFATDTGPD